MTKHLALPDDVAIKLATTLSENILWLKKLGIDQKAIEDILMIAIKFNIKTCFAVTSGYEKENS